VFIPFIYAITISLWVVFINMWCFRIKMSADANIHTYLYFKQVLIK